MNEYSKYYCLKGIKFHLRPATAFLKCYSEIVEKYPRVEMFLNEKNIGDFDGVLGLFLYVNESPKEGVVLSARGDCKERKLESIVGELARCFLKAQE